MPPHREIRADFDRQTIVVYQAYGPAIAEPALAAGRLVAPFSFTRKPGQGDATDATQQARGPGAAKSRVGIRPRHR